MCGISGILAAAAQDLRTPLTAMVRAQAHRGPDADGFYFDACAPLALGHNRLAIHDLTPSGAQPMASHDKRWVIVLNGEIYNYEALRKELARTGSVRYNGSSDTEVLVQCLSQWGIAETLRRIEGMFAFAAWDTRDALLYLARDRVGEKPLHYGYLGGDLFFASELGAIAAAAPATLPLNPQALPLFLQFAYIPAPHTVYERVFKLEPAHYLTFSPAHPTAPIAHVKYWDVRAAESAVSIPADSVEQQRHLHDVLLHEVGLQMSSDVPLGAFLSGGIDSSLVVALMQAQSARPIQTFTIGFEDKACNEAPFADAVARHLGTAHTTQIISDTEALAVLPSLPQMFGEPFADSSQIPTYLVAKLARQSVTVSLSGDGGDENFWGYNRYFTAEALLTKASHIPSTIRHGLAKALRMPPPHWWDVLLGLLGQGATAGARVSGDKVHKLAGVLAFTGPDDLYAQFILQFPRPSDVLAKKSSTDYSFNGAPFLQQPGLGRMAEIDLLNYLPDDILVKVDRTTMAVSLESRAPLLSRRVVEFAWALPVEAKVGKGQGKQILRDVLSQYVPVHMFDRPKMGFGVPLDRWLRTGLREWAEALLTPARLQKAGFDVLAVRQLWEQHVTGRRNWQYKLWPLLMWQSWLESQARL